MAAQDLAHALAADVEAVAVTLFGQPTQRAGHEWRWGSKGSLAVVVRGPKRGRFFNHEIGAGGDALELVKFAIGGTTIDAMRWASHRAGMGGEYARQTPVKSAPLPPLNTEDDTPESERPRVERALTIWRETIDLQGSIAETYLRGRGIEPPAYVTDLRFHPTCPAGEGQRRPAMVGLMRDVITNEPCAVHRTFLTAAGEGKDSLGKKMLGRARGAVIKLCDDAEVITGLGIAEGIENALTLGAYGWWPIWAAGSAGAIRTFPVLAGVECLTIFSDADDKGAGIAAARECATRWSDAGQRAEIHNPPAGQDWNDTAREFAA